MTEADNDTEVLDPTRTGNRHTESSLGWGKMESGEGSFGDDVVTSEGAARRYEITGLLGRGGMGEVHSALDERVGRSVALKVLHGSAQSSVEQHNRFRREARVQGKLEHPGIVPVYDLDRDAAGRSYIVMKRVAGVTLEAIVRGLHEGDEEMLREYPQHRLLSAFLQACLAIEYAHAKGVVHRDIKLSNLMLGDFGEVYVLDWGIAKIAGDAEIARERGTGERPVNLATRHDDVLGTLGYMAPEQIADSTGVDGRADVYALGVVLFALLARDRLHRQRDPIELATATQEGVDARPSVRSPHLGIAPELDVICDKATRVDPSDRYQSARELHDAVQRFLQGDRDKRLRMEIAANHLDAAHAALAASDAGEPADSRRVALREAGRALALHPTSEKAAALVTRLMLTPPDGIPPEVEEETQALSEDELSRIGRIGAVILVGAVLGVTALFTWMGVRSWLQVGLFLGPLLAGGIVAVSSKWVGHRVLGNLIAGACIAVSIAAASRLAGSLWIPPMVAMVYIAYVIPTHGLGRVRLICIAMAFVGVLTPWLLELTGVIPSQYVFSDGVAYVQPSAITLAPERVELGLMLGCLSMLGIAAAGLWHFSQSDMKSRRQLQLIAWQLRQLAPRVGQTNDGTSPETPAVDTLRPPAGAAPRTKPLPKTNDVAMPPNDLVVVPPTKSGARAVDAPTQDMPTRATRSPTRG